MANGKLRKGITGLKKKIEEIGANTEDACRKRKRPTSTETINLLTWNMQGGGRFGEQPGGSTGREYQFLPIATWQFLPYINHIMGGINIFCLQECGNLISILTTNNSYITGTDITGNHYFRLQSHKVPPIEFETPPPIDVYRYLYYVKIEVQSPSTRWPTRLRDSGHDTDHNPLASIRPLRLYGYYYQWDIGGGRVNLAILSTQEPQDYLNDFHIVPNPYVPPNSTRSTPRSRFEERPILGMKINDVWYYTIHNKPNQNTNIPDFIAEAKKPCVIAGDYNIQRTEAFDLQDNSSSVFHPHTYTHHARGLDAAGSSYSSENLRSKLDHAIVAQGQDENFIQIHNEEGNVIGWNFRREVLSRRLVSKFRWSHFVAPIVTEDSRDTLIRLVANIRAHPQQLQGTLVQSLQNLIPADHLPVLYGITYGRRDTSERDMSMSEGDTPMLS